MIVGAGPTGLALALSLARSGIKVRLIEKLREPAATSRAIGIQARTLEMLDMFGLADAFVDRGHKGRAGNIYAGSRRLVHLDLALLASRYPYILFLEQTETERLLSEALAKLGVEVERGVEMISFQQTPELVTLVTRTGNGASEQIECEYLVGCDGAHSATRRGLDLQFDGKTLSQQFLLADLDMESWLTNDEFHIFTSPDGLLAIFPMSGGHRVIAEIPSHSEDPGSEPQLAEIEAIVARRVDAPLRLSGMRWSSYFKVNSRLASRLQDGRVFLVGDAAHIHSPAGAQGMNTGIQDAFNLGWKLAFVLRGDAAPDLLATYQAERYPVERGVLRKTELLTRIVSLKSPFLRFFRDRIAPRITALERVQRVARRTISQIGVSYRALPVPTLRGPGDVLRAGDRAPDTWVQVHDNAGAKRLHALLDPTRFTLLLITRDQPVAASNRGSTVPLQSDDRVQVVIGIDAPGNGIAESANYAGEDRFYLIRPDGYLALVGPLGHAADAKDFLQRYRPDVA
ncbi:MAG: FAD-binding monooxygenase [Sphingomonas bacterium]|uniref:FAD-dependent monooxygenase n=1 Tax=Sphingomonas bacterium TaxID=1895847 RepID=UPI002606BE8C|nr:FAD-dependent monooxygenase [Sphingomonas bacterium]MDB5708777.1 FAD-binding monooxygenase [Sphingomonas bacterium]